MQLNYFKKVASELRSKLGEKGSKSLLSNAVYMFSIGNNDYLFPFSSNSSAIKDFGPQQFAQMVIGNFTYVIEVKIFYLFYYINIKYFKFSPS